MSGSTSDTSPHATTLLGDTAEDFVSLWATQAGFNVTPSARDRHGWDRLIQLTLPRPSNFSGPLGLETLELSAKIQVKGTRSAKRRIPIKLSNWRRAIEDPLPWFFVILRFASSADEPIEASVIHVDRALVEAVLQRIYKLPVKERSRLHRYSMTLRWSRESLLAKPYPEKLRSSLTTTVGGDSFSYSRTKQGWYDSAGREPESIRGTFRVQARTEQELYSRLARAAIGLDESLEVTSFSIAKKRFGVEETDPRFPPGEGGHLRIDPAKGEQRSKVIFSRPDASESVVLPCSFRFSASVFPKLPKDYWMFRIQTRFLDLVLEHGTSRVNVALDPQTMATKLPLRELFPSFALLDFFSRAAGESLCCQIEIAGDAHPIGKASVQLSLEGDALRLVRSVCRLWALAGELGADLDAPFALEEILERNPLVELFMAARHGSSWSLLTETTLVGGDKLDFKRPCCVIVNPLLRIGSLIYCELVTFSGIAEVLSKAPAPVRIRVKSSTPQSEKSLHLSMGQALSFPWDDEFEKLASVLESRGIENVIKAPLHRPTRRRQEKAQALRSRRRNRRR